MPNALGIGLLGPLQVRDETGHPVHVGGRQLRVLLTLLALNAGRVVPVTTLAGELWPDDPPGNPGNALQTLVSRLRAELRQAGAGDVIESDPGGYRLAVPPEAADVMAFEELAAQGRRALADGDARLAERPRAQLMRALYAAGRQAEAIAAYHEGRELLADQLGVDPSAQLEQVYLGILRGGEEPASDPERAAVPAQARPSAARAQSPLTSFVGRDEDLSRVLKNLRAARLVTLTGPGGVGKTRLAIEASGRLGAAAWFVPLARAGRGRGRSQPLVTGHRARPSDRRDGRADAGLVRGGSEPRLRRLRSLYDLGGSVGAGGGPAAAGDVRQHARPDGLGRVGLPGGPGCLPGPGRGVGNGRRAHTAGRVRQAARRERGGGRGARRGGGSR